MLSTTGLELWGGIECTVNRVGDESFDQLERTGHDSRRGDIALFAGLGIRRLRYPVLWERVSRSESASSRDDCCFERVDTRLREIRDHGIDPIVGLLHHGSGPRGTSLLDPSFPQRFAEYARIVAARYPWVKSYTPINEPLTTARFACLYGHWYPHRHDDAAFARAVFHQLRGICLAMRAIREVNPNALLVQTEDLGRTHSTDLLRSQAEFENERRWLTFDALCGRLTSDSTMGAFLLASGITGRELDQLHAEAVLPDVLGINHYLTSERFLDERIERYPECTHGGNGRDRYADVEAVRVLAHGLRGPLGILTEVAARYSLPIAVTEVHAGGSREHQMRWLDEVWHAATAVRACGAEVLAVTTWSLLGAFDWHNLLTRAEGRYESGAFDIRGPKPRPTAIAAMVRDLANRGRHEHPVLSTPGWWVTPRRFAYEPFSARTEHSSAPRKLAAEVPLLILGSDQALGAAVCRACVLRDVAFVELRVAESSAASVVAEIARSNAWAVVDAAAYCERHERGVDEIVGSGLEASVELAHECAALGIPLLHFASAAAFDSADPSQLDASRVESSETRPSASRGALELAAEFEMARVLPSVLIVHSSVLLGPRAQGDPLGAALASIAAPKTTNMEADVPISIRALDDLVHVALDLLVDDASGRWHLVNDGAATWFLPLLAGTARASLDPELGRQMSNAEREFGQVTRSRPRNGSERARALAAWELALTSMVTTASPWIRT